MLMVINYIDDVEESSPPYEGGGSPQRRAPSLRRGGYLRSKNVAYTKPPLTPPW